MAFLNKQPKPLEGARIFKDDKGNNIYLDFISKNGYLITKNKELKFRTYYNSGLYSILLFIVLFAWFNINFYIASIIGVVAYVLLQFRFRKFLNTLTLIPKFNPSKKLKREVKKPIALFSSVLYLTFAVLLVLFILNQEASDNITKTLVYALIATSLYCAFKYLNIAINSKNGK